MACKTKDYFNECLYFTANSLARTVSRLAEEEFASLGMSSSHAFLMMLADETPGITQKELAEQLNLAQSTVSRFVDGLVKRGYLEKKVSGKTARVALTDKGKGQVEEIHRCWLGLYERCNAILTKKDGDRLTRAIHQADEKLKAQE